MKQETLDYILKKQMLHPGDRVVVGVSGGADSVCLMHILWCLKETLSVSLRAVHIHHGLRGEEADLDAAFAADFCRSLGVPCNIVYIEAASEARAQGISVEEAGRTARYRELQRAAREWKQEAPGSVLVAVAHHGDDNAETILHNLFRGSGLKGLGGILPVRGNIIRPLLWAARVAVLAYLKEEKLDYVEDSTNQENDYTRNRIRNHILPLIEEEVNSRAVKNILQAGERMAKTNRFLETLADEWIEKQCSRTGEIPLPVFRQEDEVLQEYILRQVLERSGGSLRDITAGHVEELLALRDKQTGKRIDLPGGLTAVRQYEKIRIIKGRKADREKAAALPEPQMRVFKRDLLSGILEEIPRNRYTKWFDYDKIKDALSVRFRRTGDYFTLAEGKRKTVKAYMIDEKIPAQQRDSIPLVAEGSHVLWITGYRISEYYKVSEQTKNVLEIQLDGGTESGRQDQSLID